MTGAKLSKELTKRGRDIAGCEVFIDTGEGLKSICAVDYDEDNSQIVLIPEAKSMSYNNTEGGGDKIPEN